MSSHKYVIQELTNRAIVLDRRADDEYIAAERARDRAEKGFRDVSELRSQAKAIRASIEALKAIEDKGNA